MQSLLTRGFNHSHTLRGRGKLFRQKVLSMPMTVSLRESGEPGTTEFRVFFERDGKKISPWHDIPLKSGDYYNFISEIPKFSRAKFEGNSIVLFIACIHLAHNEVSSNSFVG
jgi:inorganic pyrophosphatase